MQKKLEEMLGFGKAEIFRQKLNEVETKMPLFDHDLHALQNEVTVLIQQNEKAKGGMNKEHQKDR